MDPQRLMEDVTALTAEGSREVGSIEHERAGEYIADRLADLGLKPYATGAFALPYGREDLGLANILATIPGSAPDNPPVLLCAHYDTCGDIPGADDNAAAVAILLGVAEIFQQTPANRPVVFAFFDAEEPPNFLQPTMGSIRFYEDQRTGPVHAAIVLDLVGHDVPIPGMEDLLFITGAESDPDLISAVRECEPRSGLRTVPTLNRYVGDLSDHHVFRMNRSPYLFLTCGHWEHYHTPTDTPDRLNYDKMAAVADYVRTLTERLCTSTLDGPFEGSDTLEAEIYFLEKNIMPTLRGAGLSQPLNSRADVDRLVTLLIGHFGL